MIDSGALGSYFVSKTQNIENFPKESAASLRVQELIEALNLIENDSCSLAKENLFEKLESFFDHPVSSDEAMRECIKDISPRAADALLSSFYTLANEKEKPCSPKWIIESIRPETLSKILKNKYENVKDLSEWLNACKEMLEKPVEEISAPAGEIRKIWQAIVRFITNLIDTFLIAFTLFDVGKDPQSAWEAHAMLDVYYKFFMIPAVIAILIKILVPLAEFEVYAITAGTIMLGMIFLTIYIRFLRPCPDALPHCETNLTKDAIDGKNGQVFGRDDLVEELIRLLVAKKRVLLVGPSGVGKNEIVKELAQRIARGQVPDALKGRKVPLVNTGSLIQGGFYGYADQVKLLLNRVRDLKHVVLFFDELQAALKKTTFTDFLKPIIDNADLMCVAATTHREFKEYIEGVPVAEQKDSEVPKGDLAFLRRFHVLHVDSMKGETLEGVLKRHQQKISSFICTKKEVITYMVKKIEKDDHFKDQAEPAFALSVLDLCINSEVIQFFDEKWESKKLKQFKAKVLLEKTLASEDIDLIRKGMGKQGTQEVKDLSDTLKIRKIFSRYKQVAEEKRKLFASLYCKIESALQKTGKLKGELEANLFLEIEYKIPGMDLVLGKLENELENLSKEIGEDLTPSVSIEVIDKVLARLGSVPKR